MTTGEHAVVRMPILYEGAVGCHLRPQLPVALRLLGIYHRQITVQRTSSSLHFRALKNYPTAPKTLGEFLRQRRVDLGLSQRKLAKMLDIGVTDTAVEKWENSQNRPTESHRRRIIEFLGFDPATTIPTGGS